MARTAKIRVHYPLASGRILLRAAPEWDRDLPPSAVSRDGTRHEFDVPIGDAAFRYLKPLLRDGARESWARGANSLAVAGRVATDLYPSFFSEPVCEVCRLERRGSRDGRREHAFRIFTPPGYHENTLARYPVLYMHDGQNLFFPEEAFQGETWRVEETLENLGAMNLVRPVIVVGIHPMDRMVDYTSPGYEPYGRYLAREIKPFVDARYRTLPEPGQTGVLGSSLGGVVSLHLALAHPETFGLAGCLSSTFGFRDDLFERVASGRRKKVRIYLDSGWPGDNFEATVAMRDALLRAGWRYGENLRHVAVPRAAHDERAWAARLHDPLQFLLGSRPEPAPRSRRIRRTSTPRPSS